MIQAKGKCNSCGVNDADHVHHIVPTSRGGRDNKGNLTSLCDSCHGLAHNVDFNGSTGLISGAVSNKKSQLDFDIDFLNKNSEFINSVMLSMPSKEDLHLLVELLNFGQVSASNLVELAKNGVTKVRFKKTFYSA